MKIKKILLLVMAFVISMNCLVSGSSTFANGNGEVEIYEVGVTLYQAMKDQVSMGNSALSQKAYVIEENGKYQIYLDFQSMDLYGLNGYLVDVDELKNVVLNINNYPETYVLKPMEVVSTYNVIDDYNSDISTDPISAGRKYPKRVSFSVEKENISQYVWIHIYVPVMGILSSGDQMCRLGFDWDNMKESGLTKEEITNPVDSEEDNSDSNNNSDSDENQESNNNQNANTTETPSTGNTVVNKTELNSKLEEAAALVKETTTYTEATITNLSAAIAIAKGVYENANATSAQVNAQVQALTTAILALVKQSTEQLDKNNLADGIYNIYVSLWHAVNDQASMGDAAMNHDALLTVEKGIYKLSLSTKIMKLGNVTAGLHSLQIAQRDGSYLYADITANNNSIDGVAMPSAFAFELPSKEEYISVKIDPQVAIMGNQPLDARLKISWDTLTAAENDTVLQDSGQQVTTDSTENSDSTSDANASNANSQNTDSSTKTTTDSSESENDSDVKNSDSSSAEETESSYTSPSEETAFTDLEDVNEEFGDYEESVEMDDKAREQETSEKVETNSQSQNSHLQKENQRKLFIVSMGISTVSTMFLLLLIIIACIRRKGNEEEK